MGPSTSVDPAMMTAKALKRAPDPPLHFRAGAKRPLTYERRSSPTPGGVSGGGVLTVGGSGMIAVGGSGPLTVARAVSLPTGATSFTTMALPQDDDFGAVSLSRPAALTSTIATTPLAASSSSP